MRCRMQRQLDNQECSTEDWECSFDSMTDHVIFPAILVIAVDKSLCSILARLKSCSQFSVGDCIRYSRPSFGNYHQTFPPSLWPQWLVAILHPDSSDLHEWPPALIGPRYNGVVGLGRVLLKGCCGDGEAELERDWQNGVFGLGRVLLLKVAVVMVV